MIDDEIIKDLEKLISDDSVYALITTSDIKKIISKYNGLEKYLSSIYKLDYYNSKEGFAIELTTMKSQEFDVKKFTKEIEKKFNRKVTLESIGIYNTLYQVVLYFEFGD